MGTMAKAKAFFSSNSAAAGTESSIFWNQIKTREKKNFSASKSNHVIDKATVITKNTVHKKMQQLPKDQVVVVLVVFPLSQVQAVEGERVNVPPALLVPFYIQ